MAQIITVTIEGGKITAEAHGAQGKGCAETIDKLLNSLGGKKLAEGLKPEFYKPVEIHKQQGR